MHYFRIPELVASTGRVRSKSRSMSKPMLNMKMFEAELRPSRHVFCEELQRSGDPFGLFELWLGKARKAEPNDPNVITLATVDDSGLPDVRMTLLNSYTWVGYRIVPLQMEFWINQPSRPHKRLLLSAPHLVERGRKASSVHNLKSFEYT